MVFGTYDVSVHPRGAVLIEGLAEHGFDVVEVNEPLALGTADRVEHPSAPHRACRSCCDGLCALLGACCWSRSLSVRSSPTPCWCPTWVTSTCCWPELRWPRTTIVLDHLVSGGGHRARPWRARWAQAAAARPARPAGHPRGRRRRRRHRRERRAAAGRAHAARGRRPGRGHRRLVRGGRPGGSARDRGPGAPAPLRVVFFGSFTPLQGTTHHRARASADCRSDTVHVTLLGTGQDHAAVRRILVESAATSPGTTGCRVDDLPDLVAEHDVCLGIFGATEKALTVVPTKIYQGAAAGCVVVTSDTAPHRRTLGDAAVLVPPADDAALRRCPRPPCQLTQRGRPPPLRRFSQREGICSSCCACVP